ncbi:hypothetical protein DSO57_1030800 [Entomophthora muscae]|uniref:Uncharacterized protein n=1 Tax=Entomophthora muscae TaxID=34485 RepID=A0ACC2RRS5_9FUNG|nr:hypothetical protein DSO57_1030800 [Entomophthora muscae]
MLKATILALSSLDSSLAFTDHFPWHSVRHASLQNEGHVVLVCRLLCLSIHILRELVLKDSVNTKAIILKALPRAGLQK